jgi:arylsulfatase A-like enzyme
MQGRPLQALIEGDVEDWRQEVFVQISESQVGRALRTRRWKYGVTAPDSHGRRDAGSDRYVEQHLYDLEADPHERNNLVADPRTAELRATLAEALKRRITEAGERAPVILPQD